MPTREVFTCRFTSQQLGEINYDFRRNTYQQHITDAVAIMDKSNVIKTVYIDGVKVRQEPIDESTIMRMSWVRAEEQQRLKFGERKSVVKKKVKR